jgi:hypothetical protein
VERLHEVVDRLHLEGLDRELVVRGHEHDGGHRLRAHGLDHLEPRHAGHLHVEEDEVGVQRAYGLHRLRTAGRLAHHVDSGGLAQVRAHLPPRRRLVVDDEDPRAHAGRR